jgi:hypothetical protein
MDGTLTQTDHFGSAFGLEEAVREVMSFRRYLRHKQPKPKLVLKVVLVRLKFDELNTYRVLGFDVAGQREWFDFEGIYVGIVKRGKAVLGQRLPKNRKHHRYLRLRPHKNLDQEILVPFAKPRQWYELILVAAASQKS